jgi:hypothetical protein
VIRQTIEAPMSRLTIFLARYIGLSTIVLVAAMAVRGSAAIEATAADAPVMLAYGIISLGLGIAMIVGHNVWTGGLLPVVVTLVGWLIAAKGLVLLLLPPETTSHVLGQMHYGTNYYFYLVPALVIGLYLAWAGFTAPRLRDSH